jgi:hypothetical protein
MAAYIHPDNQQLLWNIVNSNSILAETFSNYTPVQKDEWFKSIIELFYKKIGETPLTKPQLHQLNKDTLAYMIQLSHRNHYMNNQVDPVAPSPRVQPPQYPDPALIQSSREELFTQQFQKRETEFKSMLEVKPPVEIDFREKIEDSAIQNMDELIQKHKQERAKELEQYKPPLPNNEIRQENISATIEENDTANTIAVLKEDYEQMKREVFSLKDELKEIRKFIENTISQKGI